ncbi:MAG: hypothetical protein ACYDG2_20705 [Ruminiclostridium sp.]
MEEILKEILAELKDLKQGQNSLELSLNNLNDKVDSLENKMNNRFNKLEAKVDAIQDQVAILTEFKTETAQRLTAIDGGKK